MAFGDSEEPEPARAALHAVAVKVLVAGGFGVGKTTLVGSVSEIPPLHTEELLTEHGAAVDDLTGVEQKATTTVALDFGRITISPELILYLFGTPGQDRFWFMWDELARGALGAIVLADTRRLDSCFPAIDFFERRRVPFVIGVNCFDGVQPYPVDDVRDALDVGVRVPVRLCDARNRESNKQLLVTLVEHIMATVGHAGSARADTAG
jgi:signal recognition particle receptor subunit beta